MHQIFLCKCGWLLYIPSTLPCGHTMCKHCADENLFCIYCGHTIDEPCSPNLFLVQLLNVWFPNEYLSTRHKKDAKTLFTSEDYELALNEINISISLVNNDYTSYQLRAEIYLKLEEYKSALADLNESCELNPDCGKSQFIRGCCFSHLGKLNHAIDAFQLCLELEPEDMTLCNSVINKLDSILSLPDTGSILSDNEPSLSDIEEPCPCKEPDKNMKPVLSSKRLTIDNPVKSSSSDERNTSTIINELDGGNGSLIPDTDTSESEGKLSHESEKVVEKLHGVPKNLINEDDFECKLCYELMLQPITTSCGHVFCKHCLLRSLDHNITCPICRLSLSDFLKDQCKSVTLLIEEILDLFFNKEFNKRKLIYSERMNRMSRVGVDEQVEVPIFVCAIAFPYVKCPLHIFEPKYRLMIRECIESGLRKFGMCVHQVGAEGYSGVGTICEISKIENLPDGRYIINATAGQRFIVQQKSLSDSTNYAKVKYFSDEPEDLNNELFIATSRRVYDHLSEYITSLNEADQDCIFNALGPLPQYEEDFSRFQHGVPWVWWGLAALPLNFSAKLVLLRSKCVSERMLSLQRFLKFLSRIQTPNG